MSVLVFAFLVFLPVGLANMAPVIASRLPLIKYWNTPLDMGKHYKGNRVFGDHKTWRGLISGVLAAMLAGFALHALSGVFESNSLALVLAATGSAGFGALAGDAVESFFKRRRSVDSGSKWFPFDQIDYIIGGLVFYYPFINLELNAVAAIFVIYFGLHLLVSYIGYLLGFKATPI